ncbi:MAG: hypothetical protein SFV15_01285 [Polyangiaceae bacterium]|nr:hypothetical protein [Polyangiaceae bacterium]
MPVARGSAGTLDVGNFRAGATLSATAVNVAHKAGCADLNNCTEVPVQPEYLHDQGIYPAELRLFAEFALGGPFGLELQLPFRMVRTTIHYETLAGAPYEPMDAGVHHRNETVAGPADPWMLLRIGQNFGSYWLAARPGISLPLGSTEENPFALGDQGLRHQHIQLGSGTFDPLLILEASTSLEKITLDAFAQAQTTLYNNTHGYRAPTRFYGGAHVGTDLTPEFGASLGPEFSHEDAERWGGEIQQDGLLGRSELLGALRVGYKFNKTELSLSLRVPLWRRLLEGSEPAGKFENPLSVALGVVQAGAF